ncbi:hypothetical protein ES703_16171 [subsurface metagenome]
MKNVIVKYYSAPEIPAAMFLSSECSMQDVVIEHLEEEITAEETKGRSSWKIYYIDNKAVEMKHFDEFGRFYKMEEELIEQRLKTNNGKNIDEIIQQNKDTFNSECLEFAPKINIYRHGFYHYNTEGLLAEEEWLNKEQKLEYKAHYFYNDLNQLVRTESTDFDEELYGYTEKSSYNEEGILIKRETIDNNQTISLSELTFQDKRYLATVNIYKEDDFLKRRTILKKLSNEPENIFWEFRDLDPLENGLINVGYRIVLSEVFDLDNTVALIKKYFYNRDGYLIAEEHFRGGISKVYIDKIYVYYYNVSNNLRTRKYYKTRREKLDPELVGTEHFFYDSQNRLIRTNKRLNLFGEVVTVKTYVYDKEGLLTEKRDTGLDHRKLCFYNKKGEKIREESYFRNATKPRAVERWRYDKEGKIIENEYSSVITLS